MSSEISGISGIHTGHPIVSAKPGTASYLVRITGTGADQYVRSARIQTIAGIGLLGGGMYAALKHSNTYWGHALAALTAGGLLVTNALFNTLGGLNQAARDFARKNFNTPYFDTAQVTQTSNAVPTGNTTPESSVKAMGGLLGDIGRKMSIMPYV